MAPIPHPSSEPNISAIVEAYAMPPQPTIMANLYGNESGYNDAVTNTVSSPWTSESVSLFYLNLYTE